MVSCAELKAGPGFGSRFRHLYPTRLDQLAFDVAAVAAVLVTNPSMEASDDPSNQQVRLSDWAVLVFFSMLDSSLDQL